MENSLSNKAKTYMSCLLVASKNHLRLHGYKDIGNLKKSDNYYAEHALSLRRTFGSTPRKLKERAANPCLIARVLATWGLGLLPSDHQDG